MTICKWKNPKYFFNKNRFYNADMSEFKNTEKLTLNYPEKYRSLIIFVERLRKLNIEIELVSNFPLVYITKINKKSVLENLNSEHGFVIGYFSHKENWEYVFSNLKETFNLIKRFVKED